MGWQRIEVSEETLRGTIKLLLNHRFGESRDWETNQEKYIKTRLLRNASTST